MSKMVTLKNISRVMDLPWAYRAWQAPFVRAKFSPILRHNDLNRVRRVLDVGCGPGTNANMLRGVEYVGVDFNPSYIELARRQHPGRFEVADAGEFKCEERFDFILLNSLLHHIDSEGVNQILSNLLRMLAPDGRIHILDLILPEEAGMARFLATSDRGDYARPLQEWTQMFESHFHGVVTETYRVGILGATLWNMIYFKGRAR